MRKGEIVGANSIYQSMTAICSLYEEWMEVMEDYATVFSADNSLDIPANMSSEDISSAVRDKNKSIILSVILFSLF